jgi:hypothetical protein
VRTDSAREASWCFFTSEHVLQNIEAVNWASLNWHLPLLTIDDGLTRGSGRWRAHSTWIFMMRSSARM